MGAYFRCLLEEADGDFVACRLFELLEADRGGEARGAAADDDHVVLHAVPLHRFLLARREAARRGGRASSGPTGGSGQAAEARRCRRASAE